MKYEPSNSAVIVPSELVESTNELVALNPRLPTNKQISSKSLQPLINKIDKLLDKYIANELMFADFVKGGAVGNDGLISDTAIAVHRARKDSIAELIKVKMNLEGIATEHKSVVHRFDVNGLLEALREARDGKTFRRV